jgi:hypothetical protein
MKIKRINCALSKKKPDKTNFKILQRQIVCPKIEILIAAMVEILIRWGISKSKKKRGN